MRGVLWCLAAWVAVGSVQAATWQTNLVPGPSAEEDGNRDALPDGWAADAYQSPAKLAWDRDVAHSGRASLRISDSLNPQGKTWGETTGRWTLAARRPVKAGAAYTLEAWIRTEGVTGRADVRIAWFSDKRWLAESTSQPLHGTRDWQRVEVHAAAPPEATEASVYAGLSNSAGSAWFDDISLVAGTQLPGNFRPLSLAAASTAPWTRLGGPPPEDRGSWRGVPLAAGRGDRAVVSVGGAATGAAAVEIPVGHSCHTVYFLHAASQAPRGATVATYEIAYQDLPAVRLPIRAGREACDLRRPAESDESAVAWETDEGADGARGMSLWPWSNPHPQAVIRAIRISGEPRGELHLAAITTADGPAVLTERPLRYEFNDTAGWYPFTFSLEDVNRESIDLTRFLDAPAGKHGRLGVREDGHFYFADGTRARFFGTNICSSQAFPAREDAVQLAARLAKYGVNLVRIHAIDNRWAPLVDHSRADSRQLNAAALDRLDFFVAELEKRGIYLYFDLLDYREFKPGDGVPDAEQFQHGWQHSIKAASCFNERMIELQKEFATQFLTHRNPYTQLRYVDDPAVAVVEITNENSVFYLHNTGLTLPVFVRELEGRWNAWLGRRYGGREGLVKAWSDARGQCALGAEEDPARGTVVLPLKWLYQKPAEAPFVGERSPVRVDAMARFLAETQQSYYRQMRQHLRQIGVRVPITGTNQTFCPASVQADSINDFVSRNNYWQHPNVHAKPYFTFRNVAVVNSDLAAVSNPMTEVASSTVHDKPMIVPEFNFPWPNEFRGECLPLMTAYACLQDWDGLLLFAYDPRQKTLAWFGSQSDPVRWGQYVAAATMFYRRDVAVAKHSIEVAYSDRDTFTAGPMHGRAACSPYRYLTYVSKVRNAYFDTEYRGRADAVITPGAEARAFPGVTRLIAGGACDYQRYAEAARRWGWMAFSDFAAISGRYASDTGELSLDQRQGLFCVDTLRTQAAVGFLGAAGKVSLGQATIVSSTPFAAITVTALDDQPIGNSRRLLITAVARAENSGQAFINRKRSVPAWGRLPVLCEPVGGEIRLRNGRALKAHTLDPTGRRDAPVAIRQADGELVVRLDELRSPWCELSAD